MQNKPWIWAITLIALALFFILIIYGFTEAPHGSSQGNRNTPPIPTYIISLASIFIIIAIIPVFYVLLHKGLEKNFQETMKILVESMNSNTYNENEKKPSLVNCETIFFNFLNYNEKKVIKKIIEQKGQVIQSEISRMENMGKVKAHRIVKDLEKKGIINVEKYGNTNRITLNEDVKKILKI
jgi:uncharacterized membrane protein